MKKIFCFLIPLYTISMFTQTITCGVDQQQILDHFSNNSNLLPNSTYDATTKYVFNVRFHVIYNDDGITRTNANGDSGLPIGENEVLEAIKTLNVNFNQFNIFFKYYGYDKIISTDFLIIETSEEMTNLQNHPNTLPNAMNLFVCNGVIIGADARGYFFNDDAFINEWILTHEMGHILSLTHPSFYQANGCQNYEHAERRVGYPNFNADSKGDMVVDTHIEGGFYDSDCNYLGGGQDCLGEPIISTVVDGYLIKPSYGNFMYGPNDCTPIFTPGQGRRMREAIVGYWASTYNAQMNTIESLYQPFETTLIGGNVIISAEDLGNGYANVCRNMLEKHRFQKGFDYIFPQNNGNPDQLNTGINDIPYDVNHTFNYPVIINQINPSVAGFAIVNCTRGVICEEEEIIGGIDYITDNLDGYNFTVEEWDKLQATNPNFYDYLQSNKYHIIKRETEKGVIIQVIIYKP